MIIHLNEIDAPSRKTLSQIKLAIMDVCDELGIEYNISLTSIWKIEWDEKEKQTMLDLISEKLKNCAGWAKQKVNAKDI